MTKNRNARIAALILAALLSMFLLPLAAFADGGDYYAYELPPGAENPESVDGTGEAGDWIVEEEPSDIPEDTETPESPEDESPFGDFSFGCFLLPFKRQESFFIVLFPLFSDLRSYFC